MLYVLLGIVLYLLLVLAYPAFFSGAKHADHSRSAALRADGARHDDLPRAPKDVSPVSAMRVGEPGPEHRRPSPTSLDCTQGETEYRRQAVEYVRGLERRGIPAQGARVAILRNERIQANLDADRVDNIRRRMVTTADVDRRMELAAELRKAQTRADLSYDRAHRFDDERETLDDERGA